MSLIETLADTRDRLDSAIADAWENKRREIGLALGGLALAGVIGYGVYWWVEVRFRPPP